MVKRKKVKSRLEEKGADVTEAPASKSSEAVGKAKKRKAGAADVTEAPASKSSEAVGKAKKRKAGAADVTEAPASKSSEAVGKAKKRKAGAADVMEAPASKSSEAVGKAKKRKAGAADVTEAPASKSSEAVGKAGAADLTEAPASKSSEAVGKAKKQKGGAQAASSSKTAEKVVSEDFTVFVDGVPYDWSIERVTEFFSKCGPVREVRAPTWQDSGRLRGYAHVAFEGAAGKEKALKLDKAKVGKKGRYLKIEPAKKPNEGKAAAGDIEGKRRLFVKNLPYDAAEDDIAKLFSKCGKVLEIRIPHTSGRSKGFAYVEFAKAQGLRTAMELDPAPSLQGRKLLLDADVGSGPKAGFHHRPDAFQSNFGPKKKGQGKGGRGGRGGRGRGKPSLF